MAARSGRGLRFLSVRVRFVSQIPGATDNPVGAGLPAKALDQPGRMETDTAPSLASQLPQFFCGELRIGSCQRSKVGACLLAVSVHDHLQPLAHVWRLKVSSDQIKLRSDAANSCSASVLRACNRARQMASSTFYPRRSYRTSGVVWVHALGTLPYVDCWIMPNACQRGH